MSRWPELMFRDGADRVQANADVALETSTKESGRVQVRRRPAPQQGVVFAPVVDGLAARGRPQRPRGQERGQRAAAAGDARGGSRSRCTAAGGERTCV